MQDQLVTEFDTVGRCNLLIPTRQRLCTGFMAVDTKSFVTCEITLPLGRGSQSFPVNWVHPCGL